MDEPVERGVVRLRRPPIPERPAAHTLGVTGSAKGLFQPLSLTVTDRIPPWGITLGNNALA